MNEEGTFGTVMRQAFAQQLHHGKSLHEGGIRMFMKWERAVAEITSLF